MEVLASDASALPRFFGLEAEFFKEFAGHVAEPLEHIYSVDCQYESVLFFRVAFQFSI